MQQQLDIIRGMLDNNAGWFPGFTHLAGDPLPQTSFAELPNGSLCKVANSNTTNLRDLTEMLKLELYQYTGSSTARSLFKRDEKNKGILRTELASQKMRACVENESCSGLVEMRGQWGRGSSQHLALPGFLLLGSFFSILWIGQIPPTGSAPPQPAGHSFAWACAVSAALTVGSKPVIKW